MNTGKIVKSKLLVQDMVIIEWMQKNFTIFSIMKISGVEPNWIKIWNSKTVRWTKWNESQCTKIFCAQH